MAVRFSFLTNVKYSLLNSALLNGTSTLVVVLGSLLEKGRKGQKSYKPIGQREITDNKEKANSSAEIEETLTYPISPPASSSIQTSILYKSIAGRYRPVSYPDGPITARYRFIKNDY